MTIDPLVAIAVIAQAVVVVVWLVRLEGRVNGHDRELKSEKEQRVEDLDAIRSDLQYIRERIDWVTGMGAGR